MDILEVREYLLTLPNVWEGLPFGDDVLVYKVGERMFAALWLGAGEHLVLKCEPRKAEMLRERYDAITPAWHFNKKHWNDLNTEELSDEQIRQLVRHSYLIVIEQNVTPKALRQELLAQAVAEGIIDDSEQVSEED